MLDGPEKIHDELMQEYGALSETLVAQMKEKLWQEYEANQQNFDDFQDWGHLFRDVSIMIHTSIDAALMSVAYVMHRRFMGGGK